MSDNETGKKNELIRRILPLAAKQLAKGATKESMIERLLTLGFTKEESEEMIEMAISGKALPHPPAPQPTAKMTQTPIEPEHIQESVQQQEVHSVQPPLVATETIEITHPVEGVKCPKCGKVNKVDAVYCQNCGSKLTQSEFQPILSDTEAGQIEDRRVAMGKKEWLIVLVAVILSVVVSSIVQYALYQKQTSSFRTKLVMVEKFQLVDKTGKPRAIMGFNDDCILSLMFSNKNYRLAIMLGVKADDSPFLALYDDKGQARTGLGVHPSGVTGLLLNSSEGNLRAMLGVDKNDSPMLFFYDSSGKVPRLGTALMQNGSEYTIFYDQNGKGRSLIGVNSEGEPSIGVLNKAGIPVWGSP